MESSTQPFSLLKYTKKSYIKYHCRNSSSINLTVEWKITKKNSQKMLPKQRTSIFQIIQEYSFWKSHYSIMTWKRRFAGKTIISGILWQIKELLWRNNSQMQESDQVMITSISLLYLALCHPTHVY